MIITRAPLRLTFGGAPTDLDSYSRKYGGFCISATINKYVYVAVNRTFNEQIFLKYSNIEKVKSVDEIGHPIFREAIRLMNFKTPQLEISSMADVPSDGSGLGNSGAFTVALLKALYQYRNIKLSDEAISAQACDININKLGKVQGKQDEYASMTGGINCFYFETNGNVRVEPLNISYDNMLKLQNNLLLFYTGFNHDTNSILKHQESKTQLGDKEMIRNLNNAYSFGQSAKNYLEAGNLEGFGQRLNDQWENKEQRMLRTNPMLKRLHMGFLNNGAIGAKLIGSGGGGFMMIYTTFHERVRDYAKLFNMEELRFSFDFEGCKRII